MSNPNQPSPGRLAHVVELGRTLEMKGEIKEARKYINQGLAMPTRERDDSGTKQREKNLWKAFADQDKAISTSAPSSGWSLSKE